MDGIKGIGPGGPTGITGLNGANAINGASDKKVDFGATLKEAINNVNDLQKEAGNNIAALSEGKASLHETMVAIEKAGVSFQLMQQVRNKILTAYEEVMRTQV